MTCLRFFCFRTGQPSLHVCLSLRLECYFVPPMYKPAIHLYMSLSNSSNCDIGVIVLLLFNKTFTQ